MTRQFLFSLALAFLSCCDTNPDRPTEAIQTKQLTKVFKTEQLTSATASEIHKILRLPPTKDSSFVFMGQYTYYKDNDSVRQLHGPFHFSFSDSGSYEDIHFRTEIEYLGNYKSGKPIDLTQRILNDDGIDYYANWAITLYFDTLTNDCILAKFKGKIGYVMPDTTFEFLNPDTCSFQWVVDTAWSLWGQEWTRRQNAR